MCSYETRYPVLPAVKCVCFSSSSKLLIAKNQTTNGTKHTLFKTFDFESRKTIKINLSIQTEAWNHMTQHWPEWYVRDLLPVHPSSLPRYATIGAYCLRSVCPSVCLSIYLHIFLYVRQQRLTVPVTFVLYLVRYTCLICIFQELSGDINLDHIVGVTCFWFNTYFVKK